MEISTQKILKVLYILSWIIFVGICVEAGAVIFNAILTLTLNPNNVKHLWQEVNLTALYQYDAGYFFVQAMIIGIVAVMKAIMFYLIIKILHHKKLNMTQPFNKEVGRFIFNLSFLCFLIGVFSWGGVKYAEWFVKLGVEMPDVQSLRLDGADVWLFMWIILYVIAQIFKRGIEIQTENDLTV